MNETNLDVAWQDNQATMGSSATSINVQNQNIKKNQWISDMSIELVDSHILPHQAQHMMKNENNLDVNL